MKTIKDVIDTPIVSPYRGSQKTYEMVRAQIEERWGSRVAKQFDPYKDTLPYSHWAKYGYKVKKGETALKSVTFVESEDPNTGEPKTIRKTVNLFHKKQVERIKLDTKQK